MFATDHPNHTPNEKGPPLYGSIPYIQSVSDQSSVGICWVNSAHTWITTNSTDANGKTVNFVSESGKLEFLVFGDVYIKSEKENRFKSVQNTLAKVTGFAPMPLLTHLGFHFSKWAPISAEMMIERNKNFTENKFPVDVLWMDINWADQNSSGAYEYFNFNPENFTTSQIEQMNQEIEDAGRRITVICDCHIMVNPEYRVYSEGIEAQSQSPGKGNIFIKNNEKSDDFTGQCWPGKSVWIDFLNENAQDFWA